MLEIKGQGPIKKLIRLAQHRTAARVSPEIREFPASMRDAN
jgi:hypothetical protein